MISITTMLHQIAAVTVNTVTSNRGVSTNLMSSVNSIVNTITGLVGIVATITLIIGGFRYVTAGGNEKNVTAARNMIMYSIIGIIIVLLALAITNFVVGRL